MTTLLTDPSRRPHADVLASYARPWIRKIEDITGFVRGQHAALVAGGTGSLVTPTEHVYPRTP